jgi:hypothetical protein
VSTVRGMFASSDEQELQAILREVDELRRRRVRGLRELGPWWQISATVSFVIAGSAARNAGYGAPKIRWRAPGGNHALARPSSSTPTGRRRGAGMCASDSMVGRRSGAAFGIGLDVAEVLAIASISDGNPLQDHPDNRRFRIAMTGVRARDYQALQEGRSRARSRREGPCYCTRVISHASGGDGRLSRSLLKFGGDPELAQAT